MSQVRAMQVPSFLRLAALQVGLGVGISCGFSISTFVTDLTPETPVEFSNLSSTILLEKPV